MHHQHAKHEYLHSISHKRIDPPAVSAQTGLTKLIEEAFLSYNAKTAAHRPIQVHHVAGEGRGAQNRR